MAAWYPIECRHGFDCCPICDGPRRDPKTLRVIDSGSTGFLSTPMHLLPAAPAGFCWEYRDGDWRAVPKN